VPEQPYNPLDKLNLADSIEREMLQQPCVELPPPRFDGAGIYAIYYRGPFPAYAPISSSACERPIYVGKAVPPGGRRGGFLEAVAGRVLHSRLSQRLGSYV
jgi:Eco29kI-like restriction endonuclease